MRVSVSYFQHFEPFFIERGVDLGELLRGTGIAITTFRDPEGTVSQQTAHRLNARAVDLFGQTGLPLQMSHNLRPTVHGFLGHAMLSAPNLRASLKLMERFAATRAIPLAFQVTEHANGASVYLQLTTHLGAYRREYLEWGLIYALSTSTSEGVNPADLPSSIRLDYSEPPHRSLYDQLFHCPVHFGEAHNIITFSNEVLDRPATTSNSELRAFCEQRCEWILSRTAPDGSLAERVVTQLLNSPHPFPNVEEVAAQLGMAGRSLRRRLSEEGTSFRGLLSDVRDRLARKYLEKSELTVEEVAHLLGYSEAAAFSRAFKSRCGLSPEPFRARSRAC